MHWFGRHSWRPAAVGALALLGTAGPLMAQGSAGRTKFEISFPASAHTGPITGRVFVMISRTDSMMRFGGRERVPAEPREQIGRLGAPFFGRDVEHLAPGQIAMIDASDLGSPSRVCARFPPATTTSRPWSTSTPSSTAPTATLSGCTMISGKARISRGPRATW